MNSSKTPLLKQLLENIINGITSSHTHEHTLAVNSFSDLDDHYPDKAERLRDNSKDDASIKKEAELMLQECAGMENKGLARSDVTSSTDGTSNATSTGRDIDVTSVSSPLISIDTENVVSGTSNAKNVTSYTSDTSDTPPSKSVTSPKGVYKLSNAGKIPDAELFYDELPFLSVYDNAVLSAPEKMGKTALLYVWVKKVLLANPHNFVFLVSEIPRPALKHLYGMLPPDLHARVDIASARRCDKDTLASMLSVYRNNNPNIRMLWVIDTLKPFATSWGMDTNNNKDMGELCNFLKEQLGLFSKAQVPCTQLTLHHKGKPNNKGEVPKKGMGATAIFSQHSTVIDFQSDKQANFIQISWDSQTVDMGNMGFKFTESVRVGTRSVWSDYKIEEVGEDIEEQKQSVAELEELSDAVNFAIMCEDKEVDCNLNPTNYKVWHGCRQTVVDRIFKAAKEGCYFKQKGYGEFKLEPNQFIIGGDRRTRVNNFRKDLGLPKAEYTIGEANGKNRIIKKLEKTA
ncbi:MAG: hypothetical protein OYH77_05320 [Pseudomonadota bacterium]|nr:hypothetical protein [Pseudomonadota bacterium]